MSSSQDTSGLDQAQAGSSGEGGLWSTDGRVRPLNPSDDVAPGGDDQQAVGRIGGTGVPFDNYRFDHNGSPPLDATEAIAKAMAAQRRDLGGWDNRLPPFPTLSPPHPP